MKEIKAKISLFIDRDETMIQVVDSDSGVTFLEMHLTNEQTCQMLSRLSRVEVEKATVRGLDLIGKKMECSEFEFEIPESLYEYKNRDPKELKRVADSNLTDGWIADPCFIRKNCFFEKDGKFYARTTIRRWI